MKLGRITRTAAATSARTEANLQFAKRSIRLSILRQRLNLRQRLGARPQGLGASFLAGDDLAGGVTSLTGSPLARTSAMPERASAHAHVGSDLELDFVIVDRLGDLADQTAGGDDNVAAPRRLHHFALLFRAPLLRAATARNRRSRSWPRSAPAGLACRRLLQRGQRRWLARRRQ